MSSRSCEAASSWSSASKARVWMSRRWGISIPCSSFAKEICFNDSGMVHPGTGEKPTEMPAVRRWIWAADGAVELHEIVVRRRIAFTRGARRKEVGRLPDTGCRVPEDSELRLFETTQVRIAGTGRLAPGADSLHFHRRALLFQ